MLLASVMCYGKDKLLDKSKQDIQLKEGVYVHRSGTRYSGKTYIEIYDVVTDSIVYGFGLEFKSDSTFIRRVLLESCDRKVYDMMNGVTERVLSEQEKRRKETIEFINSYRASYEVWLYFKSLEILGR